MNRKRLLIRSTTITATLLSVMILGMVVADTSDSATGSFGLNAPPVLSGVQFVDATYTLTNTLTPDDSTVFGVNVTVQHSSNIEWLNNVTFYIFDDSVHGSDWQSADPDGIQLTAITWNESNDLWSIDQGAMSEWTMQSPVDPGSAYAGDTTVLVARFDISRAARFDTDWNCTVLAFDDDEVPESDSAAEAGLVTMNAHYEMSFSTADFSWGADVQPSSSNNTHDGLSLQIYANAAWEIRLNATDFDPDGDDIEAQNILIWDADGTPGGASLYIRNTIQTCTSTWDAQAAMSDEIGFTRTCYFFLNPGTYFTTGVTHNTTVTAWIQGDT